MLIDHQYDTGLLVTVAGRDQVRHPCACYPRLGWRCGACGRGWVKEYVGATCSKCGADVVFVERSNHARS